jgi:hypothetical protein
MPRLVKAKARPLPLYWPDCITLLQPMICTSQAKSGLPVHLSCDGVSCDGVCAAAGKVIAADAMTTPATTPRATSPNSLLIAPSFRPDRHE